MPPVTDNTEYNTDFRMSRKENIYFTNAPGRMYLLIIYQKSKANKDSNFTVRPDDVQ